MIDAKGDTSALSVTTVMITSAQEKMKMKEVDELSRQLSEGRQRVRKRKSQLLDRCESQLKDFSFERIM